MYIFRRFGGRVKNILFRWSSNCSVSGASYYIGKIAVVRYVYSIYSLNFKPIHKFESPVAFYLFGIDSVGVLTESSSSKGCSLFRAPLALGSMATPSSLYIITNPYSVLSASQLS